MVLVHVARVRRLTLLYLHAVHHGNLCCMHVSTTDACSMGLDQQRVAECTMLIYTLGFDVFLAVLFHVFQTLRK